MSNTRCSRRLLPIVLVLAFAVVANVGGGGGGGGVRAEEKAASQSDKPIRIGIVGIDTSHATAFTKTINGPDAPPELAGMKVVAAFPSASPDLPDSIDRVEGYTKTLREGGVEIVDSMPALLEKVDAVLLESVDGRKHLELVRPIFEARKPVFIDKPLAASLAEGIAIADLAKKHGDVPWFSASALRFTPGIAAASTNPKLGGVLGCDAYSPCSLNATHADLFWYGIHGVETLFTVMGPGCATVTRVSNADVDHVTGVWADGRVGTFRGIRKGKPEYGATVFGAKANAPTGGFGGYGPLLAEIGKFFRTGKPPITPEQTIEILAFMEAADESKRQDGKPVTLASVMEKAKADAAKK